MRNNKNKSTEENGEIRIIAGQWRSRKLLVPNVIGLRPTTDRVRETLFNWLQFDIANKRCLDVCAGSGALGFEALSRGAQSVHFVEVDPIATTMIKKNADFLRANLNETVFVHQMDAISFLSKNAPNESFDFVFVDPPFELNMHAAIFTALLESECLSKNVLIYCEMPSKESVELPSAWTWYRQKSYKNVTFGLITA